MANGPLLEGVRTPWRDATALDAPELYEGIRVKRSVAFLIDVLLIAVAQVVWWSVGAVLFVITLSLIKPLLVVGSVLLPFAYHIYFIGGAESATPGMRVMKIRAVTAEGGERPSYLQAFLLTALFYFSVSVTSWLILLISLFNPRGRCLHDFLAGLLILRADARPQVSYTVERSAP